MASLFVPGLGQLAKGDWHRAVLFLLGTAAVWAGPWIALDIHFTMAPVADPYMAADTAASIRPFVWMLRTAFHLAVAFDASRLASPFHPSPGAARRARGSRPRGAAGGRRLRS